MIGCRWILLIAALGLGGGCRSLLGPEPDPVPLPIRSAVRVQSGNRLGSGCMILSSPSLGSYILTTAHLLEKSDRVWVAVFPKEEIPVWKSAQVLGTDSALDITLLWLVESYYGDSFRVQWHGELLLPGAPVVLLAAPPGGRPGVLKAEVIQSGRLRTGPSLSPGMSGAGIFCSGRLSGILYGRKKMKVSPEAPEGRYVSIREIRKFLGKRFEFLATGKLPTEPR